MDGRILAGKQPGRSAFLLVVEMLGLGVVVVRARLAGSRFRATTPHERHNQQGRGGNVR